MTHKSLYTFSLENGRVLQYKNGIKIARLHSFSYNKSKIDCNSITLLHKNLLACSNCHGTIVVVDIFTRRKRVLKIPKTYITTLSFLDNETLISTDANGLVKVHYLKTLSSSNITAPSLITLLKNVKELDLKQISYSILAPLIANNSLILAFELIDEYPLFIGTAEYNKLQEIYRVVFKKAIEELRKNSSNNAHKLLDTFKNISSKKEKINALFLDFKHYDRFKLHITEKKYSIAYAISTKHPALKLTPEFKKMEDIFKDRLKLAHEQMLLNQKDLAKETLNGYVTILSKRDEIKDLLSGNYSYDNSTKEKSQTEIQREKLLLAYEKSNFKECYELIDNYSIDDLELVILLEKHWIRLIMECEDYALDGNIKAIKMVLGELISTKTRADKIGDLLRVAFYSKIKTLQNSRKFSNAENIIYSYIDIFGVDIEIKEIMREYEKRSSNRLALTHNNSEKVLRNNWLNAAIIVES